jgi:outer membrane scaffolding protein for murein synthesis (MipA/OmpV family)
MEVWKTGSKKTFPYFHTSSLPNLSLSPVISVNFLSKNFFYGRTYTVITGKSRTHR